MVMTRVTPRGPSYACKHAHTYPCVIVDIRAGIPAKMVDRALESATHRASCQASSKVSSDQILISFPSHDQNSYQNNKITKHLHPVNRLTG
jgi:hypothetical protein